MLIIPQSKKDVHVQPDCFFRDNGLHYLRSPLHRDHPAQRPKALFQARQQSFH